MQTTGPFSLTLNALETIDDPTAQYGNPATQVQMQNASPFILNVLSGGSVYTIQSFTAQTIPTTGGESITVTPTTGPSGTQGNLIAIFLLNGENPPMGDGQLTGAAQYAQGLGTIVNEGSLVSGSPFTVNVSPTMRTLLITAQGASFVPGGTLWAVVGGSTGLIYRQFAPPYLLSGPSPGTCLLVVPISGLLDPTINIEVTGTVAAGTTYSVAGDTAAYEESDFYNGQMVNISNSLSAAGSVVIIGGPLRLTSASVLSTGSAASGSLHNGSNILIEGIIADQGTGNVTVTFPPNTLVEAGSNLELVQNGAGATFASIGYAYP